MLKATSVSRLHSSSLTSLQYIGRQPAAYAPDYKLPLPTEANIRKFAETILPPHIRSSFEEDFVARKPTMYEYIHKLRKWRDKFEEKLDRRPHTQSLETYSPHLSEFRFQKFGEVEVPGQYLLHRDKNTDFIKIERFLPNVDLIRTVGFSHRRLKIRGHDGSVHAFAIQHPAARHSRREERVLQLFRIFNGILAKRKESRRRNLNFYLPLMIPLAPSLRLVQDDTSYVSLQGIFEDHCRRNGLNKDDPVLFTMDKIRAITEARNPVSGKFFIQCRNTRALTRWRDSRNRNRFPPCAWKCSSPSKKNMCLRRSCLNSARRSTPPIPPFGFSGDIFLISSRRLLL